MDHTGKAVHRLPIIGIMGSGSTDESAELADIAARIIARKRCHLLTGGGGGLMAVAARAFTDTPGRKGLSIGILPAEKFGAGDPPDGYPNPWVELPIQTHLTRDVGRSGLKSRNTVNVLTAAALIFLPGGRGTFSELRLARQFDRPRVLFLGDAGMIDGKSFSELQRYAPLTASEAELEGFLDDILA